MKVPLVMYPNGFLARSETLPEGGIIVEEPDIIEDEAPTLIDQTKAVLDSMNSVKEPKG